MSVVPKAGCDLRNHQFSTLIGSCRTVSCLYCSAVTLIDVSLAMAPWRNESWAEVLRPNSYYPSLFRVAFFWLVPSSICCLTGYGGVSGGGDWDRPAWAMLSMPQLSGTGPGASSCRWVQQTRVLVSSVHVVKCTPTEGGIRLPSRRLAIMLLLLCWALPEAGDRSNVEGWALQQRLLLGMC